MAKGEIGDARKLVTLEQVSVRFGRTIALDGVSLDFVGGEIHTLIGENGAGKSTLLRILAGLLKPTSGRVELPSGDRIEWVPQETGLAEDLTVAEWIFLGREISGRAGLLRRTEMRKQSEAALRQVAAEIPVDSMLRDLSPPQHKQVQLARALRRRPDLLLVDEPTAVLGAQEAESLWRALRRARDAGSCVVYVSHHLTEVLALADRVTVLRDGKVVSSGIAAGLDEAQLVARMVGRDIDSGGGKQKPCGAPVLHCRGLSAGPIRDFNLALRQHEIVGLAGLVGSGRSEVLETIAGIRPAAGGEMTASVPAALLPEDRGRKGLIPTFSIRENILLPAASPWLRPREERKEAGEWLRKLEIRATDVEVPVNELSGGNQQKVLLARVLRRGASLLLFDEPTAGVDIAVKAEIHDVIRSLAFQGAAILLASSDLPELLQICDRIVALRGGRISGIVAREQASEERLAGLIVGGGA